ncbi:MAG: GMC family oxidoreductase [Deltaproteobacteria bacterium]|uniref:GMC family oxidoreductase n=1 Tax=Candidatus Zymogenus saltonus TaxID=2844893 RepID=A0A9D8KHW3_9DELT|nr:GMC family oxidoreductase [Candidatus Zymogenus saltonus]
MNGTEIEYDVIVVGSGPGGSTVAREMSLSGKRVLLLERGGNVKRVGNTVSAVLMSKSLGLTLSREGNWVVSGATYGGTSNLAAGCAVPPPEMVFAPHGIDLTDEVACAKKEMWINRLPDELVGETNLRLLEAANDLGNDWDKMESFIDPEKCVPECSDCMFGCGRGAKWTARVYGDEAQRNGADLKLRTRIDRVLTENGRAVGVEGRRLGKRVRYFGKVIVLSAALGNVPILKRAGIDDAGRGFACDFLKFAAGIGRGIDSTKANPMTVGTLEHYESDGLVIIPVFYGWSTFAAHLLLSNPRRLPKLFNHRRYTGVMVKIKDDVAGEIYPDGTYSKPVTGKDRKKLDKGVEIAKRVLKKVGCREDSFFVSEPMGAHPSASCRIGEVVDSNLETRIKNLYCCDSSVFPEALGLPVVWTVVSLGKRLAKRLNSVI